jgi:hypothetical protein
MYDNRNIFLPLKYPSTEKQKQKIECYSYSKAIESKIYIVKSYQIIFLVSDKHNTYPCLLLQFLVPRSGNFVR